MEVIATKNSFGTHSEMHLELRGIGKKWITLASEHFTWRFSRVDGWEGSAFKDFNMQPWQLSGGTLAKLNALADANGGTWKPKREK
jgi:hypothetical protein